MATAATSQYAILAEGSEEEAVKTEVAKAANGRYVVLNKDGMTRPERGVETDKDAQVASKNPIKNIKNEIVLHDFP